MSIVSDKSNLRTYYLRMRNAMTSFERTSKSKQIAQHFLSSEFFDFDTFHIFISIDKFNEIETQPIIDALWEQNKNVVVPKMKGKILQNCAYTPLTNLIQNNWGIFEPATCTQVDYKNIDVVLVPLLISDNHGNRIGYGGGFYDRFLPNLKKNCKLIGMNYFDPIPLLQSQPHDIPLDYLITPNGIIKSLV